MTPWKSESKVPIFFYLEYIQSTLSNTWGSNR